MLANLNDVLPKARENGYGVDFSTPLILKWQKGFFWQPRRPDHR